MSNRLAVVIMAGGAGTRFWPLSTEVRPKQFLTLVGETSLLQQAYERVSATVADERILVLTNDRFVDMVGEQLPIPKENIIGEPMRRDTAAAVALGALLCKKRFGEDCIMAVLTADHHIHPLERFQQCLASAVKGAEQSEEALYTFGIQPTYAATGYGYLQMGAPVILDDNESSSDDKAAIKHYELLRFKEKPDLKTAQSYVESKDYCWNSGMFVWSIKAILSELERLLPDHLRHLGPAIERDRSEDWPQALTAAFEKLDSTSIDFAVMENATKVRSVVGDFNWNDVGGWLALEEYLEKDPDGNSYRGQLTSLDAQGNLSFCEDSAEHVAIVGVKDLVVVRSGNRTLIVHRDRTEDIKSLVKNLPSKLR